MFIYGTTATLGNRIVFRSEPTPVNSVFKQSSPVVTDSYQEVFLSRRLAEVSSAISELGGPVEEELRVTTASRPAQAAVFRSITGLGLADLPAFATSITSTEEVNATPTSISSREPTFSYNAAGLPFIGGEYDGSQGDNTLTFTVTKGGKVARTSLMTLAITDSQGFLVDTIELLNYQAGEVVALNNGLEFSLGEGRLFTGDSFSIDVSASIGSAVDPDAAFNGTGDSAPNFEWGVQVTAGSFNINGQQIQVDEADTMNTVLGKINASAANVTATFDFESETVLLTHNAVGAQSITLDSDTSGFLNATKLDAANAVTGSISQNELTDPMGQLNRYAAVNSGSLLVNGNSISIDTAVDSLDDVITKIDEVSGIQAYVWDDQIIVTSSNKVNTLTIDSNGTGFFEAVGIQPGSQTPVAAVAGSTEKKSNRMSTTKANEIEKQVGQLQAALESLFDNNAVTGSSGTNLNDARSRIRDAIRNSDLDLKAGEALGLTISLNSSDSPLQIDSDFRSALRRNPKALNTFLFGAEDSVGLLQVISSEITAIQRSSNTSSGTIFDFYA
ncbi:MAG: hypothetical protein ACE361_19670 [Aureliella sp.]